MSWMHDLVVIGAGSAGLTAAGGAARLGLRVALVERDRMGGECLNSGCVPSKALLAAAHRAVQRGGEPDWAAVRVEIADAIAAIAPHDAAERFEGWGVEVIRGHARLAGGDAVEVGGRAIRSKRIVLAVGSQPAVPAIDGLAETPFLTNETVFGLQRRPGHLVILGGGPNGIEFAQAFRRLGADVTVIEPRRALAAADPDAAAVVLRRLRDEGVEVLEGLGAIRAARSGSGIVVTLEDGRAIAGSHVLVAAGRTARTDGLGLERAGVRCSDDGILADRRGQTSNRRIMAIGDCRAGPRLTHAAGEEGSIAVRRIGFGLPAATRRGLLPSVVYTDPELAQLGVTEAAARRSGRARVTALRMEFAENDRAVAEGDPSGFIKLVRSGRRVVGVTIVGRGAGDLLLPWSLVMAGRASLWTLSGLTVAYPTRSEISKALAFATFEDRLFGATARRWARLLARLRR